MKRNRSSLAVLILVVFAVLALTLSGCSGKNETAGGESATLECWAQLNSAVALSVTNLADTPLLKEIMKKTGINVKYIHPPQGQGEEAFNLLLASGDMPDIIEYNWYGFPGGPDKAINDGFITSLNDLIPQHAPNLHKYLQENPDVDKMLKTNSGNYYVFPFIRGDEYLLVFKGPIVRADWLEELNIKEPETIDDWYNMLKAFRDKKGASAPLAFKYEDLSTGIFGGAFGVKKDFYVENGKVKYGPVEPGYKDFLITLNKWYKEGLLDKNFASADTNSIHANVLSDKTGAIFGFLGSDMGKLVSAADSKPGFKLLGVKYPTLKAGERPKFGHRDIAYSYSTSAAISAGSDKKELAARFLDYGYGSEGHMLYNFGIEGESYKINENGYPEYTDLILKNPDGWSITQALAMYTRSVNGGPIIQDKRYMEQYLTLEEQRNALETWMDTDTIKYNLPRVVPKSEDSSEFQRIMNDVKTKGDEMLLKFILGVESIDKFDDYVKSMKDLGIDRVIEIQQAALELYESK